jgi:hypothetical protein
LDLDPQDVARTIEAHARFVLEQSTAEGVESDRAVAETLPRAVEPPMRLVMDEIVLERQALEPELVHVADLAGRRLVPASAAGEDQPFYAEWCRPARRRARAPTGRASFALGR